MEGLYTTLKNFLPAGTITFPIITPLQGFNHSENLAQDGWTTFPSTVTSTFADDPAGAMESLRFLVHHRFVAATYLVDATQAVLFVRVYVIPWDLPGSRGELRSRDEDGVLRPGRRRLKALFLQIRQDPSTWEGDATPSSTPKYFWDNTVDNRSLLDIYNDLPSPAPRKLVRRLPGLRSTLYGYQRRTVSTMMARENHVGSVDDPLYLPIHGVDGKTFYIQPATMEIVVERPQVTSVPGGILCEELGTGKTIMILSLILATLDQLSAPEEAFHEERFTVTPLAMRHFQTRTAVVERNKLAKRGRAYRDTGIPTLVEIMLHQCRVAPVSAIRDHQETLERRNLWQPLQANVPMYVHTDPPKEGAYTARGGIVSIPKIMYLTTATLVIVPDNLQMQWSNEILKHCTDFLRTLWVRSKDELPDAPELASEYSIILMGHSRFAKEARKTAIEELELCQCRPIKGTRIPRCTCNRRPNVSPLLQIRWKRLVVDEGHNTAEKRTDYAIFTKLLSVERRWIVTGTPTTNLLGLNFGSGSDLQYPDEDMEEEDSDVSAVVQQRKWDHAEREDFRKLGIMFADFLMMMPFASNSKTFSALVVDPIFEPIGPFPGDIDVLTQVMSSVMVRHRIEDIEQDIRLPFLQHETVLLDMDLYAVKTYNFIQATIAVNAVDSERKDQDYLFHYMNARHLQNLVANISHTMFWHVINSTPQLREGLTNAELALENLEKRNGSPEDFKLIRESLFHIHSAIDDPVWVALQRHYHCFHRIDKLPQQIVNAWNMLSEVGQQPTNDFPFLDPMVLLKLRDFVTRRPLRSIQDIVAMGERVVEEEQKWRNFEELQERLKEKKDGRVKDGAMKNSLASLKRAVAEQKLEEMRLELQAASERLAAASAGEVTPVRTGDTGRHTVASALLRLSPVANTRIRNSTSTKLDYIINEVLTYSSNEKFLIFSNSPSTISFIAEALDLVRVKCLEFSGKLKREFRDSVITTFETSDTYRVLLMELKHGARGLNLVSASRVIFCEPVWKADVESQAIKRVHRIGQIRPVTVKTLAIRGTSEEVIVARSKALKESKQEFTKELTDDRTIRDFIEHPTFLPIPIADRLVNLDVPLFEFSPPQNPPAFVNGRASERGAVSVVGPPLPRRSTVPHVEITSKPPRKKQKQVAFVN